MMSVLDMEVTIASAAGGVRPDLDERDTQRPLLVVDGDSFAHRAYHALPKTTRRSDGRPAGALVGFMGMLARLWQAEQPRAVVVGWDTLGVPTYRNALLPSYQAGRVFDDELVEQLEILPGLVESAGIVCGKAAGYEADDFLAAAAAQEATLGGTILVATSDRDAFQLAGPSTTILQPVRGVTELARIGPAEVRERYGVDPEQVVDFIALRGDPSDRIPGARGVGEKTAAALLATHGTLEALLAQGRFAEEADALRSYQRLARLDAAAPLRALADHTPDWQAAARAALGLGLDGLAERLGRLG
jgi:DNA polymerase-1